MSGLILDRYQPIGRAGSGGFGTVIVAWDVRIQRKVAIKVIPLTERDAARAALPGNAAPWDDSYGASASDPFASSFPSHSLLFGEDPDENARWLADVPGLDEARTAALLQDAHIVSVFDVEIAGRTAYLIMEYVEGITLTRLLERFGDQITLDTVAAVFLGVARALEAAHKRKVLHLDIKPDNILINDDGQVKVTDFGLATLADAHGCGQTGGGTIGYMPLEQMRREPLDVRTDEWALASVTYEMLVGANPFSRPSLEAAKGAIEGAELVVPSACWDGLAPEADDVLFCALCPEPAGRYKRVRDFREELAPLLGDPETGCADLVDMVYEELHPAPAVAADEDGEADSGRNEARRRLGVRLRGRLGRRKRLGKRDRSGSRSEAPRGRSNSIGGIILKFAGAFMIAAIAGFLLVNALYPAAIAFAILAVLWWVIVSALHL